MLQTDLQSRQRLYLMGSFLLLLFASFAFFGMMNRVTERRSFGGSGIEDPVPVAAERAARLAERKRWYAVRKVMANHGKKGEWEKAIAAADLYLAETNDVPIRLLRAEALLRLHKPEGGIEMAQLLEERGDIAPGEAALVRGDIPSYERDCKNILARFQPDKASPLEFNNTAWRFAIGKGAFEPMEIDTAVNFAERAVSTSRNSETPEGTRDLPTYTNTLGAVYVRAGRYPEAIKTLLESEQLKPEPFNYPFLILAYQGEQNTVEAKKWYAKLKDYLATTYSTRSGQDYRHELLALWREVESNAP